MTISLSDAGKRYNRDWIFRHFNYSFETGQSYAITGPNGSGKSTLLQVLSGAIMLNEGKMAVGTLRQAQGDNVRLSLPKPGKEISTENIYQYISICAPYLEVVEEMTAKELLDFHHGFKPFIPGITTDNIIEKVGLGNAFYKQIRFYSSGMKQRVKLAQAVFSDTPILLLDEPCTNLDADGVALYHSLISEYTSNRIVIVSSNDEVEYSFCKEKINILDFK